MARVIVLGTATLFAGISCIIGTGPTLAQTGSGNQGKLRLTAQERIVQRDIQEVIDQEIEELAAKDLEAVSRQMPQDFTIQLMDGTRLNREQVMHGMQEDLNSVLSVDVDRTYTRIECLTLTGKEATVYTTQQYVRTIPDRKDGSPHEVITSIRHRETWAYGKDGWVAKRVQEIEQGPTYLDGELYDPR